MITLYFIGIPTDDEQATGLERRALQALKLGKVGSNTHNYAFSSYTVCTHIIQIHIAGSLQYAEA